MNWCRKRILYRAYREHINRANVLKNIYTHYRVIPIEDDYDNRVKAEERCANRILKLI